MLAVRQQGNVLQRATRINRSHIHRFHMCCANQQQPNGVTVQQQPQQTLELPRELEGFRPNVGMCVFHPQKGVFAATRLDDPGKSWQMPQGTAVNHSLAVQHASQHNCIILMLQRCSLQLGNTQSLVELGYSMGLFDQCVPSSPLSVLQVASIQEKHHKQLH